LVILALVACLFLGAQRAAAAEPNYWSDFGFGVASVATNLVYFPCKLVYAVLGGVTGGLAYGLTAGDYAAAQHVWSPSIGGTWVVTPDMLRGREPFLYAGETYEAERDRDR
jgi:hypothetical protein